MNLWVDAKNCCDINVCHESCMSLGHPTLLGLILMLFLTFILCYGVFNYLETKPSRDLMR